MCRLAQSAFPLPNVASEMVEATMRVIAIEGVGGATTRRIAQEANAPLATLHYCFATKKVLFAEVFEYVAGQYREVLTRNDVGHHRAPLLRGVMEWCLANPDFGAATVEVISWGQRQERRGGRMKMTALVRTISSVPTPMSTPLRGARRSTLLVGESGLLVDLCHEFL